MAVIRNRLDDTLRPAIMSGVLSDMLTASLANSVDNTFEPAIERAPLKFTEGHFGRSSHRRLPQERARGTRDADCYVVGKRHCQTAEQLLS